MKVKAKQAFITAAIILATAATCACSSKPSQSTATSVPTAIKVSYYPSGIVAPVSERAALRDGIYPSDTAQGCCFLSKVAAFTVKEPVAAKVVNMTLYVPEITFLSAHPEHLRVLVDEHFAGAYQLRAGLQQLHVMLPAEAHGKPRARISMQFSESYIPKQLKLNADTRSLSVILSKVTPS